MYNKKKKSDSDMNNSGNDVDVTPPKQHKPNDPEPNDPEPNDPEPIFVVGEEIEIDEELFEEAEEIIQAPEVIILPQVFEYHHAHADEAYEVPNIYMGESFVNNRPPNDDEQYNSDDSESICSDGALIDVYNINQIVILSEYESDDAYEEDPYVDASDNEPNLAMCVTEEPEVNIDLMNKVLVLSEGNPHEDNCCEGASASSDNNADNTGLSTDCEMNCPQGEAPFYYHVPTGKITRVRPHSKKSDTRTRRHDHKEGQKSTTRTVGDGHKVGQNSGTSTMGDDLKEGQKSDTRTKGDDLKEGQKSDTRTEGDDPKEGQKCDTRTMGDDLQEQ